VMRNTLTTMLCNRNCFCTLRRHPALTVNWLPRPIVLLKSAPLWCKLLAQFGQSFHGEQWRLACGQLLGKT